MFSTTSVSVRLKKDCADFISHFFTNKQTFMRKAIETYCELSMERILHPQGGACINFYTGGYGMVQYYWNYYKGQQFIVITNESGFAFQMEPNQFREKIFEQLKIQKNEDVQFYVPCKAVTVKPENFKNLDHAKTLWRKDTFALWNFKDSLFNDKDRLISDEAIIEMLYLMNAHNSHFILNRQAFIYEQLYNATAEWEDAPSIQCKTIKGI